MDTHALLFWLVALWTGLCAVAVLVTQNIVRAAAWLLFTLAGTAGVFFLLGADFVGATQLIVYVGGILVLVVFGVMLTAQGPFITMRVTAAEWAISTVVGLLLFTVLAVCIYNGFPANTGENPGMNDPATSMSSVRLGEALLGLEDATPEHDLTGLPPGKSLPREKRERKRMGYLLPFEIVSVHLLVVLIGAAYLARAKRRRGAVAP
ncbi:MAG TPA: NADH-quinone oxidoreductase subunit J [Gemmataceae bacterium]|nr:NADH-quinone oxidoreductase subunit J [Gemmataceae bacterium]